jgi:DNA sulfur modification protein DndD
MLFKKLIFDNYKTYYGHQIIDFYIPEEVRKETGKNIILLGGLNGSGKTTILKAILYVLFGKRGMTETEYQRLFSNVINNTFFQEGGRDCSVTLIIETDKGEEWELTVKWSFDNFKRVINESRDITVRRPGVRYGKRARIENIETFNRFIDKIIPYHAAPFFIFDGEEIKDIILRQNSNEIKDAIHKITGMEAYKQLLIDLRSIKSTLEQLLAKSSSYSKLKNLQIEFNEIENELNTLEERKENILNERKHIHQLIEETKKIRNSKIIQNSKSREVIIKNHTKALTELKLCKDEFSNYFLSNAVNIILNNKIIKLKQRLKSENEARYQKILQEASLTPYRTFINQLLSTPIDPPLTTSQLQQIRDIGEQIWIKENGKEISSTIEEIHDISNNDYNYLINLNVKDKHYLVNLLNKIEKLTQDIERLEADIRNAPESVDITEENEKLDILTKKLGEIELKLKSVLNKINKSKEKKALLLNQITRLEDQKEDYYDIKEKLDFTNRLLITLEKFVEEATILKAKFIQNEFANMLNKLFRKQDEFGKIEFDIETYTIRLFNDKGQEISINDRSAGEMQMIASSLIWALTKASDLSLPMVIDTPLGRLDSYHRDTLVNYYYKELSEQVIILSTDTEITKEYIEIMKLHSYKQYMLDYDQNKKYTIIRDGYFDFVKV